MRTEPNLYDGETIVLEQPEELSGLRAPVRDSIPRSAARLFQGFPRSFERLAAKAGRRKVAAALRRLSRSAPCELHVNRPGPAIRVPAEVYVRIGDAPVLLSGAIARPRAGCPAPLADVLGLVGTVRLQYGFALGLLGPGQQTPLSELAAEFDELYPGELANIPMPKDAKSFFAFYENSSAYVCTNRAGKTWKFSLTGGDYGPGPSIATWLDDFFAAGPFGRNWAVGN